MQKELSATILSVLLYDEKDRATGEKTGKKKIRVDYVLLGKDVMQNTERFRGYAILSFFVDNVNNLFDKLTTKVIMQPVELVFEQRPSSRDPFKTYVVPISLNTKDEVISLV